jgi:hypothetical protein
MVPAQKTVVTSEIEFLCAAEDCCTKELHFGPLTELLNATLYRYIELIVSLLILRFPVRILVALRICTAI